MNTELKRRLSSGLHSRADVQSIERFFEDRDCESCADLVPSYIKNVETIKIDLLFALSERCKYWLITTEVIKGLSYRGEAGEDFQKFVLDHCIDLDWDFDGEILCSAIEQLPKLFPDYNRVAEILRVNLQSENPYVRDSVVTVAQVYARVPDEDFVDTFGDGNLYDRISEGARGWIKQALLQ